MLLSMLKTLVATVFVFFFNNISTKRFKGVRNFALSGSCIGNVELTFFSLKINFLEILI